MDLLTKHCIFCEKLADICTIEYQKRGLPHAHILLWLKGKVHASQIDLIISTAFTSPEQDLQLFAIVKSHMVHGPCGSLNAQCRCIQEIERGGRQITICTKKYPRPLTTTTNWY